MFEASVVYCNTSASQTLNKLEYCEKRNSAVQFSKMPLYYIDFVHTKQNILRVMVICDDYGLLLIYNKNNFLIQSEY